MTKKTEEESDGPDCPASCWKTLTSAARQAYEEAGSLDAGQSLLEASLQKDKVLRHVAVSYAAFHLMEQLKRNLRQHIQSEPTTSADPEPAKAKRTSRYSKEHHDAVVQRTGRWMEWPLSDRTPLRLATGELLAKESENLWKHAEGSELNARWYDLIRKKLGEAEATVADNLTNDDLEVLRAKAKKAMEASRRS